MTSKRKTIALVAHDNRKKELIEWVGWNKEALLKHSIICTGTTGRLIETTLTEKLSTDDLQISGLPVCNRAHWVAINSWGH